MKLEILSLDKALKFIPSEKTYGVRILDSMQFKQITNLVESDNWVKINKYIFDDKWASDWQEILDEEREIYDFMGYPGPGDVLFDEYFAERILNDYEIYGKEAETIMVHCNKGRSRSPAIARAMNDIYGWGIKGLEEKFPESRRFVYEIMMDVSRKR